MSEENFGFEIISLAGSAYEVFYGPLDQAPSSSQISESPTEGQTHAVDEIVLGQTNSSHTVNESIVQAIVVPADKQETTISNVYDARGKRSPLKNYANLKISSNKRKAKEKACKPFMNRLKYALRTRENRSRRSDGSQAVLSCIENNVNVKKPTVGAKKLTPLTKKASVVGKLIPAKNVTHIHKTKQSSARNSLSMRSNAEDMTLQKLVPLKYQKKVSHTLTEMINTKNLQEQLTSNRFKVMDPKFWCIPLHAVFGIVSMPDNARLRCISQVSGCLLPATDSFMISDKAIKTALESCRHSSYRFAQSLFKSVLTVGEIYNRGVCKVNKEEISPVKIELIKKQTFKHFNVEKNVQEFQWKHIIYGFNLNVEETHTFIQKWFDVSLIMEQL
ncbi:unnamed protein product [Mytilus coruscus]|uniref:Uncharacterized protein n=1 Tax=Mytilus coruscus TaxID=42192 RepID=A0A6J8DNZ9_MYTCO|nr:unnamed protein product [Mytilus coruscus]